jgi:hypothetical protein
MKFVITESKREKLIDKYLSDEYGGLIKYQDKKRNHLIFFLKDTREEPTDIDIVFFYNKDSQDAFISWEMVEIIRPFTVNEFESKQFIKRWLKKTYGIDPVNLYSKN